MLTLALLLAAGLVVSDTTPKLIERAAATLWSKQITRDPVRGVIVPGTHGRFTIQRPDPGVFLNTWDCDEDDREGCVEEMDDACSQAGNGSVRAVTVRIDRSADGNSLTCSGDCDLNGAVAFMVCDVSDDESGDGDPPDTPDTPDTP